MITTDLMESLKELEAIASRTANMQPFMAMLAESEKVSAQFRITTLKAEPGSNPWAPWSEQRRRERMAKGNADLGLLLDTGTLLDSIHALTSASGLEVGTELDYGADLQNGTNMMAARPFLGWSPESIVEAERLAMLFIEKGA